MKKVLLILVGGRIIPNMLTIRHLQPDIIIPIVSTEQREELRKFKRGVNELLRKRGYKYKWFDDEIVDTFTVNAYDKEDVRRVCNDAVQKVQDREQACEWIFNITSGTSIMSIGAYEAAKELLVQEKPVQCWYLNTAQTSVSTLVGEGRDDPFDKLLFTISIDDYAAVHNKELKVDQQEDKLPSEERRLEFANFLIASQDRIKALSRILVEKNEKNPSVQFQISRQGKGLEYYTCIRLFSGHQLESFEKEVLKKTHEYGLIRNLQKGTDWTFEVSNQQFHFLNGGWLELYVYQIVNNIKGEDGEPLFQDVQRNRFVHNKTEQGFHQQRENELDVSMMYNAQLFIIECKAGRDAKEAKTIFTLDSVANAFGGGFVGKYLVTGLSKREIEKEDASNFRERLDIRRIRLITWDDLTNLSSIFRKEATDPTYPRI